MSCSCWSRSCGHLVFWGSYLCIIGCSLRVGIFLPLATVGLALWLFRHSPLLMLVFVKENFLLQWVMAFDLS